MNRLLKTIWVLVLLCPTWKTLSASSLVQLASESNPDLLVRWFELSVSGMTFPKSYVNIWTRPLHLGFAGEPTVGRAQALLKDYKTGRFALHWRHFTQHDALEREFSNQNYTNLADTLKILNALRQEVFPSQFKNDQLYGFIPTKSSDPKAIQYKGKYYKEAQSTPGSLFSRARFILIQLIRTYDAKPALIQGLEPQEMELFVQIFEYYLLNPRISPEKRSTNAGLKFARAAVAVISVGLMLEIGPLAGSLVHVVIPHHFFSHLLVHLGAHHALLHPIAERVHHVGTLSVFPKGPKRESARAYARAKAKTQLAEDIPMTV